MYKLIIKTAHVNISIWHNLCCLTMYCLTFCHYTVIYVLFNNLLLYNYMYCLLFIILWWYIEYVVQSYNIIVYMVICIVLLFINITILLIYY